MKTQLMSARDDTWHGTGEWHRQTVALFQSRNRIRQVLPHLHRPVVYLALAATVDFEHPTYNVS